jgi:hypothetical protein
MKDRFSIFIGICLGVAISSVIIVFVMDALGLFDLA